MNIFFIGILAILCILMIYVFFFIKRIVSLFCNKKPICTISSVLLTLVMTLGGYYIFGTVTAIVMMHLIAAGLLSQLISFILKKTVKNESFQKKQRTIYKSGVLPIIVTVVIITFGYINMINVIKTEYNYKTAKLSNGEKIKIAMISDLHMGTTMNAETLQMHMDKISEEKPDVFLLVGDIVDENTTKDEMIDTFKIISDVKTNDGIYFVYGNHDRGIYNPSCEYTEDELSYNITNNGIKILQDEVVELDDYIIIGREDKSSEQNGNKRANIETLIKNVDKSKYIINLDHQPRELQECADIGVDLELSGHTHGGQVWPAGVIADATGIFELTYGEKNIGEFSAITSSGIASWGYPIRTEQHSEYVIINVNGK